MITQSSLPGKAELLYFVVFASSTSCFLLPTSPTAQIPRTAASIGWSQGVARYLPVGGKSCQYAATTLMAHTLIFFSDSHQPYRPLTIAWPSCSSSRMRSSYSREQLGQKGRRLRWADMRDRKHGPPAYSLYACDRARRASRRVSDIFGLKCLLTFLGLHSYYEFPSSTPTRSDHSSVTQC